MRTADKQHITVQDYQLQPAALHPIEQLLGYSIHYRLSRFLHHCLNCLLEQTELRILLFAMAFLTISNSTNYLTLYVHMFHISLFVAIVQC